MPWPRREALTCDVDVDGAVAAGAVAVAAAVGAGVLQQGGAQRQAAAVVLARPPAARRLQPHAPLRPLGEEPRQLPAAPGTQGHQVIRAP